MLIALLFGASVAAAVGVQLSLTMGVVFGFGSAWPIRPAGRRACGRPPVRVRRPGVDFRLATNIRD